MLGTSSGILTGTHTRNDGAGQQSKDLTRYKKNYQKTRLLIRCLKQGKEASMKGSRAVQRLSQTEASRSIEDTSPHLKFPAVSRQFPFGDNLWSLNGLDSSTQPFQSSLKNWPLECGVRDCSFTRFEQFHRLSSGIETSDSWVSSRITLHCWPQEPQRTSQLIFADHLFHVFQCGSELWCRCPRGHPMNI